ncbi:MAG: hypothetical protein IT168_02775 [Bryobacterales bacterium]|nr:hypothetical protein [Bryobacterales bacterium]
MKGRTVGIWAAHAVVAALVSLLVGRAGGNVAQAAVVAALAAVAGNRRLGDAPRTLVLLGGWAAISPLTAAGSAVVWLVPAIVRRTGWAGATLAAGSLPLGVWLVMHPGPVVVSLAGVAAAIVVWGQRDRIKELGF